MTNTQTLSNHELELLLKQKVKTERQITVEIISLLEEVSSRKLYLAKGFGSLIEYCVKELNYSESSAYRRISAMRLAQEVPQLKQSLASGTLNLVSVTKAQTVFQKKKLKHEALDLEAKTTILQKLESKTTREAEKILLEISPEPLPPERTKPLTPKHLQITLVINEDLEQKLNKIKSLWSHKNPNPSYADLLEMLADFTLGKINPADRVKSALKTQRNTTVESKNESFRKSISDTDKSAGKGTDTDTHPGAGAGIAKRYLPQDLKARIWNMANSQCQFLDPITKKQCQSRFKLQVEHKLPRAKGGDNAEENLELLCQAHNNYRAIQHFGKVHMRKFIN